MRKYRLGIGRWLSRDPIGVIGNALLYAFCKNQPIRIVDGLGLTEVVSPVPFPGGTYSNSDYRYHLIIDDSWSNSVKLLQQTSSQYINREMDKCIEELQQHERNDKCRSINYESEFDTEFFEGENEPLDYYLVNGTIYAGNEINYVGIGIYEAWLGHSLDNAKIVTALWKAIKWRSTPSAGTYYWLEYGYNYYRRKFPDEQVCICPPEESKPTPPSEEPRR